MDKGIMDKEKEKGIMDKEIEKKANNVCDAELQELHKTCFHEWKQCDELFAQYNNCMRPIFQKKKNG